MHTLKVVAVAALFGSFSQYLARPPAASQPPSACTQWEVKSVQVYELYPSVGGGPVTMDPDWEPFAYDYSGVMVILRHCLN